MGGRIDGAWSVAGSHCPAARFPAHERPRRPMGSTLTRPHTRNQLLSAWNIQWCFSRSAVMPMKMSWLTGSASPVASTR